MAQSLARQAEALFAGSAGLPLDVTPHLRPYPEKQGWTFEVPPGFSEREVGNFTGEGAPPASGSPIARELAVVFALSPGLQTATDAHPDVPWAYYVSQRHFLYEFPRVDPDKFSWSMGLTETHTKDEGHAL